MVRFEMDARVRNIEEKVGHITNTLMSNLDRLSSDVASIKSVTCGLKHKFLTT